MKGSIYKYIHKISMGALTFSVVLMFFVADMAPFGISVAWNGESFLTSSLVFARPDATAVTGQKVVGNTPEEKGRVSMYVVGEVVRREGTLYYRVSDARDNNLATVAANQFGKVALFTVPFAGFFAKALNQRLGVIGLVGLPLFMLVINYVLSLLRWITPVLSSLEKDVQTRSQRKVFHTRARVVSEDLRKKGAYGTIFKPYDLRGTYNLK